MNVLIGIAVVLGSVLVVAVAACWHLWSGRRSERRRADRLHRHTERLTEQQRAVELVLGQITDHTVPQMKDAAVRGRAGTPARLALPQALVSTVVGNRVTDLVQVMSLTLQQVQYDAAVSADAQLADVQKAADAAVDDAKRRAEQAARASVRSLVSSLVVIASKVSRQVSEGVRRHQNDEAYATLTIIDRLVQQILLVAESYNVLGGGKLARRSPATTFTDTIRAAMNALDGFERIKYDESDVALTARAVSPTVHALALLLGNALKYSPQTSFVEVRVQHGVRGVTVTIDDAGLQMNAEELLKARQVLNGARRVEVTELGALPRTGFPVVAILSRAHGFSIDVEAQNPYRGTRVTLFFPNDLLTTVVSSADPQSVEPVEPESSPSTTASGLTIRRQRGAHAAVPDEPSSTVLPGRPGVAAAWASGTRRGRAKSAFPHPEGA
ncbi:ATP-binding protein [Streptomyces sp. NPDC007872]|uniref:ATP-binding protein n=1 Tax=Streptomyces sp. NPDC007872 TaxID=3364782 RepID=UPI0036A02D76